MKNFIVCISLACTLLVNASHLNRDLFAYKYHTQELQKAWRQDRIIQPGYTAAGIGFLSFMATYYLLDSIKGYDDSMQCIATMSGIVGTYSFVTSWISLMTLKMIWRLFVKNSSEESLKQTLAVIVLKLKTAVADGSITRQDLEYCRFCSDSPLLQELRSYENSLHSFDQLS